MSQEVVFTEHFRGSHCDETDMTINIIHTRGDVQLLCMCILFRTQCIQFLVNLTMMTL